MKTFIFIFLCLAGLSALSIVNYIDVAIMSEGALSKEFKHYLSISAVFAAIISMGIVKQ